MYSHMYQTVIFLSNPSHEISHRPALHNQLLLALYDSFIGLLQVLSHECVECIDIDISDVGRSAITACPDKVSVEKHFFFYLLVQDRGRLHYFIRLIFDIGSHEFQMFLLEQFQLGRGDGWIATVEGLIKAQSYLLVKVEPRNTQFLILFLSKNKSIILNSLFTVSPQHLIFRLLLILEGRTHLQMRRPLCFFLHLAALHQQVFNNTDLPADSESALCFREALLYSDWLVVDPLLE